jgi:hypothetical protein
VRQIKFANISQESRHLAHKVLGELAVTEIVVHLLKF